MKGAVHALDDKGAVSACPACGLRNRVRYESLGRPTRCGRCHADLPALGEPLEIPSASIFAGVVGEAPLPVLVDFWASWCGPCKMVAPELARVAAGAAGQLIVAKVNTEELPDLAQRYDVRSIPTLVLFSGGRELDRLLGARSAAELMRFALRQG